MEITVIGATGGTGRRVVGQALAAGHGVTAVAEFLVREVTAPAWVHQTPTIAR